MLLSPEVPAIGNDVLKAWSHSDSRLKSCEFLHGTVFWHSLTELRKLQYQNMNVMSVCVSDTEGNHIK